MDLQRKHELTAFSVQDLGQTWQWRVYRAEGQVVFQGWAASEAGALRAALTVFRRERTGGVGRRPARFRNPAPRPTQGQPLSPGAT